jgi:ATP synthase subunit 6
VFGFSHVLTNFLLANVVSLFIFFNLFYCNSSKSCGPKKVTFYFLPNAWQKVAEFISEVTSNLVKDIITKNSAKYFPMLAVIFNFILFSNLVGLIPYSFTSTSHLIVTFTLSFSVFFGIVIITFEKYGWQAFSLFLPANTSIYLAFLLIPVEFISYLAKPISLGARLFINLMASHSTLKIIIGFAWGILLLENALSFGFVIPMLLLVILFCLELGVALIQTYVFITLACLYIQDIG